MVYLSNCYSICHVAKTIYVLFVQFYFAFMKFFEKKLIFEFLKVCFETEKHI